MDTNIPLTPDQIPPSYARYFQADCPKADTCARFLAGKYIREGQVWGDAVYPTARRYLQDVQADARHPRRLRLQGSLCRGEAERRHAPAQPHQEVSVRKHHVLPLSSRREAAHARTATVDYQPLPPSGIYGGAALRWVSGAV